MTALYPERPQICVDGPDMWLIATDTDKPHTRDFNNVGIAEHDRELWRVRNLPHLYDDWHIEMVESQREHYVNTLEKRLGIQIADWDCTHCQRAVLTRYDSYNEDTRCPKCNRR